MKKLYFILLIFALALSLCACGGKANDVTIDYGESTSYTHDDIDGAAKVVLDKFSEFDGCILNSLTYAGDKKSNDNIEYCNTLDEDSGFTECIVFDSSFRSPKNGGGAWEADEIYTWSWYLAREANGEWVLLTYGYA